MKNTRKISIALVLVMLLMMTLAIIPASATEVRISGSFNGWGTTSNTTVVDGLYVYKVTLTEGSSYEFKVVVDGTWLGNSGTINDTTITSTYNEGWDFSSSNSSNCWLNATTGGTYIFQWNDSTKKLNVFPHNSHDLDVTTTKATCLVDGSEVSVCKTAGCGYTNTEVLAAPGHVYENGVCTGCGEAEPTEHVHFYKSTETKAATCTELGVLTWNCDCGEDSYTTDIAMISHTYNLGVCTVCGGSDPDFAYYLVGYINGANYGCEGDYQNLGEYKFVDGKLVATFTADSYVFVKTSDNNHWYLFESYCKDMSGTLIENKAEKMFVPGNIELTFTLVVNDDGTLTLSYTIPKQNMAEGENWIVAGGNADSDTDAGFFGTRWDSVSTANVLEYVDGGYQIVYTGVKAGNYQFKVLKDNNWDTSYPADNYYLVVEEDNSTVTITVSYGNIVSASVEHICLFEDATCTTPKTCSCGATEGEALGHTVVHVDAVEATDCKTLGNVEYWYCSVCSAAWLDEAQTQTSTLDSVKYYGDHQYFYACDGTCMVCYELTNENASHTITAVEAKEATCQAMGNVAYWTCSDCGGCWLDEALTQVTNRMSIVTFKDHEYTYACDAYCALCYELTNEDAAHSIKHVEAVEAVDCKTMGNIEYWYCEYCNTCWDNESATGMPLNAMSVKTGYGDHQYFYACDGTCMVCYELTNEDAAHTITAVEAKEATCQTMGNVAYWTCSDCGGCWLDEALTQVTNRMSIVTFKDHEYFYPCDKICMLCNELTNEDAAHSIKHVEASAGDCKTLANIEYWYCEYCGSAWTDEALTQVTNLRSVYTGYGEHTFVDNTCTLCGECNHEYEQNTWYHPELVAATCCDPGVAVFECIYCDHYYTEATPIDSEAHGFWGDEEIITAADCAAKTNGLKKVACANGCGAYEEVEIYWSSAHTWDVQKDVSSTCTTDGEYYAVCTVCQEVEQYTYYAEGHYNWFATCGDTTTCMECNETFTVEHNTTFGPATCTQSAYCMNCWSYVGDPLGHNFVDGVCSVCEAKSKFDATTDVTLGNDKDVIEEGTVYGDFYTVVGTVTQRTDDAVTKVKSIELAKQSKGGLKFTITETSDVVIYFASTGGSNNSGLIIIDEEGNVVFTAKEVIGTSFEAATAILKAGTYTVTTPADQGRNTRVLSVEVIAHTHVYADATCTAPKTCACGATDGEALAHTFYSSICLVCYAPNPDYISNNIVAGENKVICNEHHLVANGEGEHGCPYEFPFLTVTEAGYYIITSDKLLSVFIYTTEINSKDADFTAGTGASWDYYSIGAAYLEPGTYYIGFIYLMGQGEYNVTVTNHTHTWVDATCTTPKTCSSCNLTEGEALGHDMVVDAAKAPTCTESGLTEGSHCSRCDHKVAQETVEALGHDMVTDAAKAPTCTESGLTEGSHCSRCDHKVAQEEIPATGHTFAEGTCTVCGDADPDYVAPNFFQKIWAAILGFFANIGSFFANLFKK